MQNDFARSAGRKGGYRKQAENRYGALRAVPTRSGFLRLVESDDDFMRNNVAVHIFNLFFDNYPVL